MPHWTCRFRPYLLLALFALPALWPFFHPGLPRSNDHLIHFYRVVELDQLVRAGVLFPRWAPDLVHGYGYPVFNFVFYLAHGIVEVFHLLGLNLLVAYKATLALILLCSAWFAYRLGREYFGEGAGLATGLAYLYSPYLLYDIHVRGSLTESLMLAVLPLALLYLRRAARGHRPSVAWAGVAVAVSVLAHHATMFQAMPFLVVYALFEAVMHLRRRDWRLETITPGAKRSGVGVWNLGFGILPFVIAFLLSAFFWLPAIAEARYIQVERGTLNAAMLYSNNFVSLSELTAFPRLPVDPDLLNPPVVRPLPLAALALAIPALFRWRALPHAPTRAYLILATLGAIAFMLPLARPLWDTLPLLRLTQFPWRILGPLSLFVALLLGAVFAESSSPDKRLFAIWNLKFDIWHFYLLFTLFLLPTSALPFASPPFEAVPAAPTLADVARFEIPPTFIGTTTTGEYLPIWVKQLPDTFSNRDKLMRGEAIERYEVLPSPVEVLPTGEGPGVGAIGDSFTVTSAQSVTFVYRTFYFPGWRAALDGQPVPIRITYPEGLMSVAVPAGTHSLAFRFGTTPPRVIGSALSLVGLLITIGLLVFQLPTSDFRLPTSDFQPPTSNPRPRASHFPLPTSHFALWLLGFGIFLFRPLLYDAGHTPLLRRGLTPDGLRGVAHPLNQDFAGELTLLGWDAQRESGGADDSFTVNLYWKANHPLGVAYGFDVRLVDADGLTWSEPETPRPRDWRFTPGTDFWPEDQYILDSYVLTPLAGTPPGEYNIQVTVFALHNLQTIGAAEIGALTINRPSHYFRCGGKEKYWELGARRALILQTIESSTQQAASGDTLVLSWCWKAEQAPLVDLTGNLHLLNSQGASIMTQTLAIGERYPASLWETGDLVRDQIGVQLPATVETGDYEWQLAIEDDAVTTGPLHVTAPPRTFTTPGVAHTLNTDLGPVTLFGVDVSPPSATPGGSLTITLVWRANQLMGTSYHVFLHLLSPDGALVTQSDGVPADWTRRTTGWLRGEFVTETRTLTLPADAPPGDYTLWAGMYDPATGGRLTPGAFPDGRVPLGTVPIGP